MGKSCTRAMKALLASLCVVAMIIMSVTVIPTIMTKAATEPSLTKSSRNILVGKTYNLNVSNKINGSKYVWSTSDKKIATVTQQGVVKGIKKGTAAITCKITTKDKKSYDLTCKVTIREAATFFTIKNKVTALNLGQTYDFDRVIPKTSNDKTTWSTSNASIASPDKNGVVTALKEGTVTITGKTLSGKTDSVTFKVVDKDGIVTNQEQLDALLGSGIGKLTIKTDNKVSLTIPNDSNENTNLIIDAPKADVTNNSKFASVEIKQIAANTYYDNAVGNNIIVSGSNARIVVGPNAKVSIETNAEGGTKLIVENNGIVEELIVEEGTELEIVGTSKEPIPVNVNAANTKIKSSVPLDLLCKVKAEVTLLQGAEGTKIQAETEAAVPALKGNLTIQVKVGTGDNTTTKPVTGEPISSGGGFGGGGFGGGPGGGGDPVTPPVGAITFDTVLNDISSISVTTVNGNNFTMDGAVLVLVKSVLISNDTTIWSALSDVSFPISGKTIGIKATANPLTKIITISGGKFDGRSYTVTAASTGTALTITSESNKSITIQKSADDTSFSILTGSVSDALNLPAVSDAMDTVKTVGITYKNTNYSFSVQELAALKNFFISSELKAAVWKALPADAVKTIGDEQFKVISDAVGNSTKVILFTSGKFAGKAYKVTITETQIVIIDSNVTYTFTHDTNNITISLK